MSKGNSGLFPPKNRVANNKSDFTKEHIKKIISNLPKNPEKLLTEGYQEITSYSMKKYSNSRLFYSKTMGLKIRFDKGDSNATGFRSRDHYHVENPKSTGKHDKYLNKNGEPVANGSRGSHILPEGE